jgi:AP-2 complex subunit alpha
LLKLLDKVHPGLQEELVLKIAVLAESFAPNLEWYLDVIVSLLAKPGDFVGDDIWWRSC